MSPASAAMENQPEPRLEAADELTTVAMMAMVSVDLSSCPTPSSLELTMNTCFQQPDEMAGA